MRQYRVSSVALLTLIVAAGLMMSACDSDVTGPEANQATEDGYPDNVDAPPAVAKKGPPPHAGATKKVPVCHKKGTPAEKTLMLPLSGAQGHIRGHGDFIGTCGGRIIDADGIESPDRGLPDFMDDSLAVGDSLTFWPTGGHNQGLDWFDTDATCTWTEGDDLHVEGPAYPNAIRNGIHDAGQDPIVLDLNRSLSDGEQVDVDLESGFTFTGCSGPDPALGFFDANSNGFWDDGEDIILDEDGDGTF